MAWFSRAMAQLGHFGGALRLGIWHVSMDFWTRLGFFFRRLSENRQGYPDIRTVDHWLGGNTAERFPQSRYYIVHGGFIPADEDPVLLEPTITTIKQMDLNDAWK